MLLKKVILISFSLFSFSDVFSWGPTGHRIVARIAERHMIPEAAEALRRIMRNESLPKASTWPDEVRNDPDQERFDRMTTWHWVQISKGDKYDYAKRNPSGDTVQAIVDAETTLKNRNTLGQRKIEAVRILTHFIAEIHSPVHVGDGTDQGGNFCEVIWHGQPSNLHRVWDDDLFHFMELSYTEYVAFIDFPSQKEIKDWQKSGPIDWMNESLAITPTIYPGNSSKRPYCKRSKEEQIPDSLKPKIGYDYFYRWRPVFEQRLLQAGIRLAGVFNTILK